MLRAGVEKAIVSRRIAIVVVLSIPTGELGIELIREAWGNRHGGEGVCSRDSSRRIESPSLGRDETSVQVVSNRPGGGLRAGRDIELGVDMLDVRGCRATRNVECFRDLHVSLAGRQEAQHFQLSVAESVRTPRIRLRTQGLGDGYVG